MNTEDIGQLPRSGGQAGRPRVAIVIKHYLPGHRFGGPVQSIANLCASLDAEFDLYVFCLDRDHGIATPYTGISVEKWTQIGSTSVMYLSPGWSSVFRVVGILKELSADLIYLNSFFDPRFSISFVIAKKLGFLGDVPILLAPRGEFSPGALRLKFLKKATFLFFARLTALYRRIWWHATNVEESDLIRRTVRGSDGRIFVAQNVPSLAPKMMPLRQVKESGELRVLFLSRISRKKNLSLAIRLVGQMPRGARLTIAGPIEDKQYWSTCLSEMRDLPIRYIGEVEHDRVADVMHEHHVFLLPTAGENFGHVIFEALSAGLPVILSDQTPWRNLGELKVGADLPLEQPLLFKAELERFYKMNDVEWKEACCAARELARQYVSKAASVADTKAMLSALAQRPNASAERESFDK